MKHILNLLAIIFFFSTQIQAQTWTTHNAGTSNVIADVTFPTNDTGYVITDFGQIKKTVNGATSWSSVPATPTAVRLLKFMTVQVGVALGDNYIYKTTNGGNNWNVVFNDNNVFFTTVFFANSSVGYATSYNAMGDSIQLYKTIDAGSSWAKIAAEMSFLPDQGLFFKNSTEGFWAHDNNIFSTINGGGAFSSVYNDINLNQYFVNFAFPTIDTGYAVDNLSLMRTENGGTVWNAVNIPGSIMYDLYFVTGKIGFVCGGNGFSSGWVQQTQDAGVNWLPSYSSTLSFNCMDFPTVNFGYVGGQNGTVLRYSAGPTSIDQINNQRFLTIYPNPVTGTVHITNTIPGAKISLLNLSGQIIKEEIAENSTVQMNLENVAAGIYFIEMDNIGEKMVQKLIVY